MVVVVQLFAADDQAPGRDVGAGVRRLEVAVAPVVADAVDDAGGGDRDPEHLHGPDGQAERRRTAPGSGSASGPRPASCSGCTGCARSSRRACRGRTWPWFPCSWIPRGTARRRATARSRCRGSAGCAGRPRFRTWRGACGGWPPIPWSPCRCPATARSGRNARGSACRSIARCAWVRCRKMVTAAMVMCVVTSVYSTICHQDRFHRPLASQSIAAFSTAQSGSNIDGSLFLRKGAAKAAACSWIRFYGREGSKADCDISSAAGRLGLHESTFDPRRGKKTVRRMPVRPEPQVASPPSPPLHRPAAPSTFRLVSRSRDRQWRSNSGLAALKASRDGLVLLRQQAAGGIDQPAARLEQPGRALQDGRLLGRHLPHGLRATGATSGRDCAAACPGRSKAHPRCTRSILPARRLMRSSRSWAMAAGCTLRQLAARQPRLERIQPVGRDVEGVEPPGVAHGRADAPASCRRRRRRSPPPSRRAWHPAAGPAAASPRPAPRSRRGRRRPAWSAPACRPGAGPRANTAWARLRCRPA